VSIAVENSPFTCGATLVDVRDGHSYGTSLIGGKCWMTENLAFGTILDMATPSTDNCIIERYCPPDDAGCAVFGGLYQWDELMRYGTTSAGQGICPPAWHLPSEGEWQALLGAVVSWAAPPDGAAGAYLKDLSLPGGFRSKHSGVLYIGHLWSFYSSDFSGSMYWTSTASGTERAAARGVNVINFSTSRYSGSRANAFPARCVRD
jgi:uncharacterized protein (TIGR02145 family)